MSAKLTLASGSQAGIEEPLKHGYYMIGRDDECQLRPRSRSVSRRHCLLHHSDQGLRVFDLASANGTHVNDQRLEPNQWEWLKSGDKLRCGKIIFDVFVELSSDSVGPPETTASLKAKGTSEPPVIKHSAWEDFDIAGFLEAEDEAEREERYDSMRREESRSREVTSLDLVRGDKQAQAVLEEARRKAAIKAANEAAEADSRLSPRALRIAALRAKIESERAAAERNDAIKRTLSGTGRVIKHPLPGRSSSRQAVAPRSTAPTRSPARMNPLGSIDSPGRMKLYVAVIIATLTGCFFIYSVYRNTVGSPARVIEEID